MTPLETPRHRAPQPARRPRRVRILFGLLTLAAASTLFLVLAEVGVRLTVPAERWRFVEPSHHWQIDPLLGWVQIPNLDAFSTDLMSNEPISLRTNADGLMPASAVREAGDAPRVLLVGDSTIVGSGVEERDRIHAALSRELSASGLEVEVLNAGTEGFATDQAMLRLEQLVESYAPDIVLHCVCSNDLVANTLRVNHGLNKPAFDVGPAGALRPEPFTPSDEVRGQGSGPGLWIQHSALYRLLRPNIVVLRARLSGWDERNLIGIASDWYHDPTTLERIDWELFGALIARMHKSAEDHGARFAAYLHPDIGATWDPFIEDRRSRLGPNVEYDRYALERRVGAEIERRGVVFLPMVRRFEEQQARGPFHLLPRDPHCNAEGYRLQAEMLAPFVADALRDSR